MYLYVGFMVVVGLGQGASMVLGSRGCIVEGSIVRAPHGILGLIMHLLSARISVGLMKIRHAHDC